MFFEYAITLYKVEQRTDRLAKHDPQYDNPARKARAKTTAAIAGFARLHGVSNHEATLMVAAACQARNKLLEAAQRAVTCGMTVRNAAELHVIKLLAIAYDGPAVDIARVLIGNHYQLCVECNPFVD